MTYHPPSIVMIFMINKKKQQNYSLTKKLNYQIFLLKIVTDCLNVKPMIPKCPAFLLSLLTNVVNEKVGVATEITQI